MLSGVFGRAFAMCLALSLGACGSLPRGAAIEEEILRGAETEDREIQVVGVTRGNIDTVAGWAAPAAGSDRSRP
jgi:hypothetical protein